MMGGGSADGLLALGFEPEDLEEVPACEVWACNWKSVMLFQRVRRQWRMGFAGPVALDLGPVPAVAAALGIKLTARRLDDLAIMEAEALSILTRRHN